MSNKKREQRSLEELQTTTDRLFYEWQMISRIADALLEQDSLDQILINAFVESCALHARVVKNFLYAKKNARLDDAIAEDFFADPITWHKKRPKLPDVLAYKNFDIFANKQIAHLVYPTKKDRPIVGKGHKEWDFAKVADAIQPALEQFVGLIKPKYLGVRWWNLIDAQKGYRWKNLKRLVAAKKS